MTIYVFAYDTDLNKMLIGTASSPEKARALLRSANFSPVRWFRRLSVSVVPQSWF
jgi:hypothetical protein